MNGISKYSVKSIMKIENAVLDHFGAPYRELRSKARIWANTRHIIFYILNHEFLYSASQIGRMYGFDHTTVSDGIKKVRSNNTSIEIANMLFSKCLQAVDSYPRMGGDNFVDRNVDKQKK